MTRSTLANAELAVMELLWEEDRLTARQIRAALYPDATRAQHGTVQKLLQRLEEKWFVERDRGGTQEVPSVREIFCIRKGCRKGLCDNRSAAFKGDL